MKKWLVITNIAWMIIIVSLVVFAQNQVANVEENMLKADEVAEMAAEQEGMAMEQARLAREAQAEAERQRQLAERALKACQNR